LARRTWSRPLPKSSWSRRSATSSLTWRLWRKAIRIIRASRAPCRPSLAAAAATRSTSAGGGGSRPRAAAVLGLRGGVGGGGGAGHFGLSRKRPAGRPAPGRLPPVFRAGRSCDFTEKGRSRECCLNRKQIREPVHGGGRGLSCTKRGGQKPRSVGDAR